ncbi:hypothetical protein DFH09DRAFT_1130105 [Mycena vulgaris]|nr:hypothetical protein DFH09DRAFT_1130105 [Mycena vulgaris]
MNVPPVLSLPPEITQRIFREALPSGGLPHPQHPQQAPLLLTQICRDWRAIALDTPDLWQSIAVGSTGPPVSPLMVGLWMSRANNRPRDIYFSTHDRKRGAEYLDESMDYCQQWRDVELRLPIESFSELIAHHGPFPLLRSLSLSVRSAVIDGDHIITIRDAPLLRKVTVMDFPILAPDIAWEQLTTLKMTTHEAGPGISALQRCSNLLHLEFSLNVHDMVAPPILPFTLPSLNTLLTAGESLLPYVTLPNLEQLDIWGPGFLPGGMEALTESLHALLVRSACPLKRLSFRMPPKITAGAFRAFLQAAAPVVELKLTLYFPSGLGELVTVLQSADVLPQLTALRIVDATGGETFTPLLDALRARRASVAGRAMLGSFSLSIQNDSRSGAARVPPNAVMAELAALADDGLRIRIANGTVLMDR